MVPEPDPDMTGPIDLDERLGEAIEVYLEKAEAGGPLDPEEFAKDYPELGEDLIAALEGLALVQGLVGEANGPGHRLEEGRRVAGYRIVRELGRGGMGIVYEAVHVALDRPVALKVLGTQAAPDSSGRRRFLNEAKTAAGLHHTHIVPVWDVGQVGGLCYYAMQRIEGSGLDRVLRIMRRDRSVASGSTFGSGSQKRGHSPLPKSPPKPTRNPSLDARLGMSGLGDSTRSWGAGMDLGGGTSWKGREPVDEPPTFTPPRGSSYYRWVADVGRQAADALAHAHQRGVIHRDIKPSNLLVDARGMIWVADFGLARRLADPSQTQFDSLLGTPRYMSPEQARTGAIDGRADVYSLGATLYELITLRPPFDGQSAAELLDQIKTQEPLRPRKFDPKVPLDLETILLKALAKRPDDRYASAEALAEDLARYLAYEPVKARRIGPIGRMVRIARRHPSLTAVSTVAAASVLSIATFAYVRIINERNRADDAADNARKAQKATEESNRQLKLTNKQLSDTMLDSLEKTAAIVGLSNDANRRSKGLDLLRVAAARNPEPELRVRLRDQALAFLSMRDVEARPPIETPRQPQHGLIFDLTGKKIAALSDDGELGIWDIKDRTLVASSKLPIGPNRGRPGGPGGGGGGGRFRLPRTAAVGDRIAVISPEGAGIGLFNIASPDVPDKILPVKGHHVAGLYASSDDGRRFLTVELSTRGGGPNRQGPPDRSDFPEEPRIFLWDRDHPEVPKATLTLPPSKLDQPFQRGPRQLLLAIAPDGSKIAATRQFDAEVNLWDDQGRQLPPIDVQLNATALALGPTGLLAVTSNGGEMALWDVSPATAKRLRNVTLHQSFVYMLRFSPGNGSILAAAGWGGGVELWDLSTPTMIAALSTKEGVDDLAFSPDGHTLAASQSSGIALWSLIEPLGEHLLPVAGDVPSRLAFGPNDLLAITTIEANSTNPVPSALRLWEGPGSCPPSVRVWDQVRASSVGFDAEGRLFTLEADTLRWYQPSSGGKPVLEVELPAPVGRPGSGPGPVQKNGGPNLSRSAAIVSRTPDGRTLIISRQNGLYLWRADAPGTFKRIELPDGGGRGPQWQLVLDPSGTRLYCRRGEELFALTIGIDGVQKSAWSMEIAPSMTLAASRDGKILAFAERSGVVVLVDAVSGIVRNRLISPSGDSTQIDSLAFSPVGSTLAVGTREQVRLWAIDGNPRPLARLPGHRGLLRSLSFDARGTRLAGADEKTIRVWDLTSLHGELARLGLDW